MFNEKKSMFVNIVVDSVQDVGSAFRRVEANALYALAAAGDGLNAFALDFRRDQFLEHLKTLQSVVDKAVELVEGINPEEDLDEVQGIDAFLEEMYEERNGVCDVD